MKKVLVSLLMALLVVPSIAQTDKDHDFKMAKNMDIFNAIYKNLDLMYVDTLDAEEVVGTGEIESNVWQGIRLHLYIRLHTASITHLSATGSIEHLGK